MEIAHPFILVTVGESTAGKTTLLDNLRKIEALTSHITIRDIDESLNVPASGREYWRRYRVEEMLHSAVHDYANGHSSIIGGWIWPHEIIQSSYFSLDVNLHFLYLQHNKEDYARRLKERISHGLSEDAYAEHLRCFPTNQQRLSNQVFTLNNYFVANSSQLSEEKVLDQVLDIIEKISA